jgi:hypothetical protein
MCKNKQTNDMKEHKRLGPLPNKKYPIKFKYSTVASKILWVIIQSLHWVIRLLLQDFFAFNDLVLSNMIFCSKCDTLIMFIIPHLIF